MEIVVVSSVALIIWESVGFSFKAHFGLCSLTNRAIFGRFFMLGRIRAGQTSVLHEIHASVNLRAAL